MGELDGRFNWLHFDALTADAQFHREWRFSMQMDARLRSFFPVRHGHLDAIRDEQCKYFGVASHPTVSAQFTISGQVVLSDRTYGATRVSCDISRCSYFRD